MRTGRRRAYTFAAMHQTLNPRVRNSTTRALFEFPERGCLPHQPVPASRFAS